MKKVPEWWSDFAEDYIRSFKRNATSIYRKYRPDCKTPDVNVSELQGNPRFQEVLKVKEEQFRQELHVSREEWFNTFRNIMLFDPAMLYESDPDTHEVKLRKDWHEIAKKYGALEQISANMITLESGAVMLNLKAKAYNKMEAAEKIGKVLGYDQTDQSESESKKQIQVNIINYINQTRELVGAGKIDAPSEAEVQKLIEAPLEGEE